MAKNKVETKFEFDGLEELAKALNDKRFVKVGLIGGKGKELHTDSDTNNATIGLVHEMGSKTNNIPQRSFLRMPIEQKKKEIVKFVLAGKNKIIKGISKGTLQFLYERLSIGAETQILDAFYTGGFGQWAKLKASTIARKGSSSILIDTGQLRKAITSKIVKK